VSVHLCDRYSAILVNTTSCTFRVSFQWIFEQLVHVIY